MNDTFAEAASAGGFPAVAAMTALMADRGNCADWFPGGTIAIFIVFRAGVREKKVRLRQQLTITSGLCKRRILRRWLCGAGRLHKLCYRTLRRLT